MPKIYWINQPTPVCIRWSTFKITNNQHLYRIYHLVFLFSYLIGWFYCHVTFKYKNLTYLPICFTFQPPRKDLVNIVLSVSVAFQPFCFPVYNMNVERRTPPLKLQYTLPLYYLVFRWIGGKYALFLSECAKQYSPYNQEQCISLPTIILCLTTIILYNKSA